MDISMTLTVTALSTFLRHSHGRFLSANCRQNTDKELGEGNAEGGQTMWSKQAAL